MIELEVVADHLDTPRPLVRSEQHHQVKLRFSSASAFKNFYSSLLKTKRSFEEDQLPSSKLRRVPRTSHADTSTCVTLEVKTTHDAWQLPAVPDNDSWDDGASGLVPDWEVSFDDNGMVASGQAASAIVRQARLVPVGDALGMTVIGRNPVLVQEVEPGGAAERAGLFAGDVVCAVEGHDCSTWGHLQVVNMIREALRRNRERNGQHVQLEPLAEETPNRLDEGSEA